MPSAHGVVMHHITTPAMPAAAFPFLSELSRVVRGHDHAPSGALAAVALLTASADPARAEALRPRPDEPPALVERLAVWALRQVDHDTIVLAHALLLDHINSRSPEAPAPAASMTGCC
jgi:hypothetical protein